MATIYRDLHWTDLELSVNPDRTRNRSRTIGNYTNYRSPAGLILPATRVFEQDASAPPNWTGQYDFKHRILNASAEIFVGDSTDAVNTALVGLRLSDRPDVWFNLKDLNVNNVNMNIQVAQRRVVWPLLRNQSDRAWYYKKHGIYGVWRLRAPGHPANFRKALRIPDSMSYNLNPDGSLQLLDENGVEVMVFRTPSAWDSTDDGSGIGAPDEFGGGINIRCTVTEGDPITVGGKSFPTFWTTPNPDDLDTATYPVFMVG